MEAMAAGRCVIAGRLPAVEELIDNNVSGVLVPANDVPALAAAIDSLIISETHRESLGRAARIKIASEFSDEINIGRLEHALHGSTASLALFNRDGHPTPSTSVANAR
jgi:glycosyltransferase involved in cell wall biosynthesis